MKRFQKVTVVGLGYIGLPTAAVLAQHGLNVCGVDINERVVAAINRGEIHIVEPDLDHAVSTTVSAGRLRATIAAEPSDAFLIAVPTPLRGTERQPDLSYIESAARSVAPVLKEGDLVVLESTSPVGTTEQLSRWLAEERSDLSFPHHAGEAADIRIAYCPERVLPGRIMQELIANDRVIGGMTEACIRAASELYGIFVKGACVPTNARSAEMVKLTENSFRDVNIAFTNELSMICEELGINVWELISIANRHPRVNILQPGPGVGGHCIAVDPWFIVARSPETARLIRTAREINNEKTVWVKKRIGAAIDHFLNEHRGRDRDSVCVVCYGLAFKADVDDLRESPALEIVRHLSSTHPGLVLAVEPNIDKLPENLTGTQLIDLETALAEGDVHVLLVDHLQFRSIEPPAPPCKIVDSRGIWS